MTESTAVPTAREFAGLLGAYGERCEEIDEEADAVVYDLASAAGDAVTAAYDTALAEVEWLIREVAEYELNIEDLNTKSVREIRRLGRDLAEAIRERDEALVRVAGLTEAVDRGHEQCVQRSELLATRAERDEARATLARFIDPDPCRFDHHGFCQTHGHEPPCAVDEAKRLVGVEPATDDGIGTND